MLQLDHLVLTAPDLASGTAWAEARLGLPLQPGGAHPHMGTHNRLLSLGPDLYLEVIAIDTDAPAPDPSAPDAPAQPRWFGLDQGRSSTALTHWAARTPDLAAALAAAPPGHGTPQDLTRGDLAWRMAITDRLPFDDAYPALLSWQSAPPAPRLIERGARLTELRVSHPEAPRLAAHLAAQITDPRLVFVPGPPGLSATLSTPNGPRTL